MQKRSKKLITKLSIRCTNFLEGKIKKKENNEHSGSGALLAVPVPHGSQQLGAQQLPDVKEKRVKKLG